MLRALFTLVLLACNPISTQPAGSAATPSSDSMPAAARSPAEASGAAPSQQAPDSRPAFDHRHGRWTAVLEKFVRPDGFDYAGLKRDPAELEAYLEELETVSAADVATWSTDQRFAFWVNVYNAYTVRLVVDAYPVGSIRDIRQLGDRVWDEPIIPLEGLRPDALPGALSLNQVEHEILRKRFADARLHAAVNCASESCPPLRAEAFTAEKLDEQLDEQTRTWLADPTRNRYDATSRRIEVSRIFEWFPADFEREAGNIPAWIARHAPAEHATWIAEEPAPTLAYLDYSWRLNAASKP